MQQPCCRQQPLEVLLSVWSSVMVAAAVSDSGGRSTVLQHAEDCLKLIRLLCGSIMVQVLTVLQLELKGWPC